MNGDVLDVFKRRPRFGAKRHELGGSHPCVFDLRARQTRHGPGRSKGGVQGQFLRHPPELHRVRIGAEHADVVAALPIVETFGLALENGPQTHGQSQKPPVCHRPTHQRGDLVDSRQAR